eukprot:Skav231755  [mRNA]  locus=scaffold695:45352:46971:- [translate_table: standard]
MSCCTGEPCDIVVDGEPPWSWRLESPEPPDLPNFEESCLDGERSGLSGMKMASEKPSASPALEMSQKQSAISTLTTAELRGVSLRRTLRQARSFWLDKPHARSLAQKHRLYAASFQTNHLDMFVSHTWQTKGAWKFLSLLLQFGWPILWISWSFMVMLAFTLCMIDALPLFTTFYVRALGFEGLVPSGCWIQSFGLLGILGGCLLFPHLPSKSDRCFLDFACIDQSEHCKMHHGIRSIPAFLAASDELRVLWSPPLLSRLWCVFELAAYRKVNPEGRIIIAPIKDESCACMMFLWWQLSTMGLWICIVRSDASDGGNLIPMVTVLVAACTLIPASAYVIWHNHKNSARLRSQLANFDVMNVDCSNDFDREWIHDAIITWYGSLEAFSAHVRGPLSQEVLDLMRVGGSLSYHYVILPLCPLIALSLDNTVALCKAGAPTKAVVTFFFNQVVALDLLFLPALAIFFIWITKTGLWLGNRRCKPLALEIGSILSLCLCFGAAGALVGIVFSRRSLLMTLFWNLFACLFAGFVRRHCWRSEGR